MFKSIISFFVKAAPRFVGEMMKNPKNVTKLFKKAGEKLAKSEFAKKTENFLGQKPGEFMKECARDAVKQSATSLMMSAMTGGVTKLFSGGGGKQYSFPNKTSGSVIAGGGKAPGIQTTNAAQYSNVKAFNQTSRALGAEANKQAKLRKQQKKVIDRYRKDIQRKNFSVAELTSLSARLEKELRQQKTALTTGLKSGKHQSEGLKAVQPAKKIKQPTRIPQEQQQLAAYTKEALEDMNSQMQENIKAVNENISKSIAAMNKKEEEIAQKMMSNLGNYNTVTYKKLADTVTKTEEVSFKKQQESAYYQTDMLADKLDSSHDYNSKQLEVLRGEVLGNTQTMYELDKQSRMIDENYRALEERKNNGFTLATLGALLTQTYQMVQSSLKTPDIINDNVNNAMKSVAFTAGEEVGKFIQILAEGFNGIRAFFRKLYASVADVPVVAPMVGGLVNALDWVNDRIFRGLLGVEDSVIGDVFGTPGTLAEIGQNKHDSKYGDEEGAPSQAEIQNQGKFWSNEDGHLRGSGAGAGLKNYFATDLVNVQGNFTIKGNKVEMMTNSGYSVTLKHDQKTGESDKDYKARKLREAIDIESEDFGYVSQSSSARDTKAEASNRLKNAMLFIENTLLSKEGNGWDVVYTLSGSESGKSNPPAISLDDRGSLNPEKQKTTNCKEHIEDSRFQLHWYGKRELKLAAELKTRVFKLLRESSSMGIKYRITSMLRVPSVYRKYLSEHNQGLAIDISVDMYKEKGNSYTMGEILRSYSKVIQQKYIGGEGMYPSTALAWSDLADIVNRPEQFLAPNTPPEIYDLFSQWYTLLSLCSPQGLSFGSTNYKQGYKAMGRSPKDGDPVDLVHIFLSTARNNLSYDEAKNKEKMGEKHIDKAVVSFMDNNKNRQDKAVGEGYKNRYDAVISSIMETEDNGMVAGLGIKKDKLYNSYYYTDAKGNIIRNNEVGTNFDYIPDNLRAGYSYKDYVRNENGEFVLRQKDDFAKQIRTDEGMMIYDKIKSGKITAEEMSNIRKAIEEWDKMDNKQRANSGMTSQMADAIQIYNTFNNTTVANTPSEMSTGNTSNIPQ